MRRAIRSKLRSRRGETLTETLAAILIVGLASAGVAAMISAASRMNAEAERLNDALYEAVYAAESKEIYIGGTSNSKVTVKRDGVEQSNALDVLLYGKAPVYSYDTGGAGS